MKRPAAALQKNEPVCAESTANVATKVAAMKKLGAAEFAAEGAAKRAVLKKKQHHGNIGQQMMI